MRKILLVIFISMALASFSGTIFAQGEQKLGYVDLSRAFDEYQKTKDFDKTLEKKGDIKQDEREKMVQEIRKLRDEIELMNEKAREKKEKDIETRIRSLQEFDQVAKDELTKERDDMVRDILKEMNGVIKGHGQRNGYSIILNERVLLYGDKTIDLTDEIIKILNYNYTKK